MPGPKSASILLESISIPRYVYSSSTISTLNVDARHVPLGRENAFLPESSLIPEGPSVQQSVGTPFSLSSLVMPPKAAAVPRVTLGLPIPSPLIMRQRSSSVSWATNSSMVFLPCFTSASLMPLSPVWGISGMTRSMRDAR